MSTYGIFKLLIGGHIYGPDDLGEQNILIAGNRIAAVGKEFDISGSVDIERISVKGKKITSGFIDLHVHITGGGGEAGPVSRLPEINVSTVLSAGVTTLLGVLGTGAVTRSPEISLARALDQLQQNNIPLDQVTVSSDANGSLPRFDENKKIIGTKMAAIDTLTIEYQKLVGDGCLPAHKALKLFTSNPASRLGLEGKKGVIAPSACADILVFEDNWQIDTVFSKGNIYVQDGELIKDY